MRSYEPAEFISLLASDQLDEPMNLTVYGPVKADENDSSALLLSTSPLCEQWLRIPISSIASIQHGGTMSCKDHRHPLSGSCSPSPVRRRPRHSVGDG
jgi:hypothetical protein